MINDSVKNHRESPYFLHLIPYPADRNRSAVPSGGGRVSVKLKSKDNRYVGASVKTVAPASPGLKSVF